MAHATDPVTIRHAPRARPETASREPCLAFDFEPLALPPPALPYIELQFALEVRRSTREFLSDPLGLEVLAGLLWAAAGVNRRDSGGRTAPSAQGWHEVEVHVITGQGAWRYDAVRHELRPIAAGDLRSATGEQPFVAEAPVDFVYVADFDRMPATRPEDRRMLAAVTAGAMAQGAHLAASAWGLGAVIRASIDRPHLAACLNLGAAQHVLLAQTFGWPRDPTSV